jgi:hypothetical protein
MMTQFKISRQLKEDNLSVEIFAWSAALECLFLILQDFENDSEDLPTEQPIETAEAVKKVTP